MLAVVAGDETYSPTEAARVLSRSGRSISERRVRQMLQAGELEGEQTEGRRWRTPRREVNRILSERREREELRKEPESPPEASESVRELMFRVFGGTLSRELGRSEARLELTEQAESTRREERERLAQLLEEERAERRRLQEELENPENRNIDVINLPSREWISIELGGSFYVSVQQEQILAFSVIDGAKFRGYFPDEREFQRDLKLWQEP